MASDRKKLRPDEVLDLWVSRLIVWALILVILFPILAIITASLQKGAAFNTGALLPSPELFTLDNYRDLLTKTKFTTWIFNTFWMGTAIGVVQIALTITASYAFARLKFWGKKNGIRTLMILQMMPSFVSLAAIQFVAYKLHMANLFGYFIFTAGAGAWSIWLMKGYIDGIPRDLDEAAKVDGCTDWEVFIKIILPLSYPMMAVLFLFSFIGTFSEFIMASALLKQQNQYILLQGLRTFTANAFSTNWGRLSAAVVLASVPLAILWAFGQRYVTSGLTRGAVKG
ncbi:MAG TPA: ABC transporter permease subunit [Symbiobacteriaceae bacterium]|nr:ABC transporter permease subunit [Symbiobacteriaceae bacterium]